MFKKIILFTMTVILSGILSVSLSSAAAIQPGSQNDPLVSKSYVDDKINQLLALISSSSVSGVPAGSNDQIVNEVMSRVSFMLEQSSSDSYHPVNAIPGQRIIGTEGTEIILRSGGAAAYCPGENGIVDLTDGVDIGNNQMIRPNHFIIIPRTDGRGVHALTDCWFMIKGSYNIE